METHIKEMMESEEQAKTEDEKSPKNFRVIGYEYYGGEVEMME